MFLDFDKTVSPDVVAAARNTLGELANVRDAKGGGRSPLDKFFVSDVPLAVYSLSLDGLKHGGDLDNAKAVAWRVFVLDGHDEPIGVAEVAPAGGGHPAHFLGYTQGQQVASSGKALSDAEARGDEGRYEPRFLEIPGLNVTALWLRSLGGGVDTIIPVDPVPRFLRERETYTPTEFLDRVRPQATKRLEFDDVPTRR
jgi:hypothetical protein